MKIELVYNHVTAPVTDKEPDRSREAFHENARRFVSTYRTFDPGIEHSLTIVFGGQPEDLEIYSGLPCRFEVYRGNGWDLGAYQFAAWLSNADFIFCMHARVHFKRPGWLKRLIEARQKHGDGLYGPSGSYQGCPLGTHPAPNPHMRGMWGLNPAVYRDFPHVITSRDDSFRCESGEWNISRWFEDRGMPVMMVTWDGEYSKEHWRTPPNIFRRGDQSNLIVFDRHSDIYEQATPEIRLVDESRANGADII